MNKTSLFVGGLLHSASSNSRARVGEKKEVLCAERGGGARSGSTCHLSSFVATRMGEGVRLFEPGCYANVELKQRKFMR